MVIRIVIADDHPIYRDGLARTLIEAGGIELAGQAKNADEAVEICRQTQPDVVLLDISMPGSGISAAARIASDVPKAGIAMLTVSENNRDVMSALRAGATGYVLKGISASELVSVVQDIAAGKSHISPELAARVLAEMQTPRQQPERDPIETLTKREEDILRLVSTGKSNKEVARALDLQEKTVKHYMTAILQKLQVRNRVEAALKARESWGD
ncbi:MAG: response regulator [Paracoccaceae bacterium]